MKKLGLLAVAVVMVFAFSVCLLADDPAGQPSGFHGKMMGKRMHKPMMGGFYSARMILGMAAELDLTADQFAKLKEIMKSEPKKDKGKGGMKDEMEALKAEFKKDTPDEAKIDEILIKMNDKKIEAMKERIHNMLAVKAVLTKEQKDILKKKMENMKKKWMDKGQGKEDTKSGNDNK